MSKERQKKPLLIKKTKLVIKARTATMHTMASRPPHIELNDADSFKIILTKEDGTKTVLDLTSYHETLFTVSINRRRAADVRGR